MSLEQWDKHPGGNIALCPLVGWQFQIAQMTALARIEFVRSESQLVSGQPDAVQLAMTALQCRELAQTLLRTAQALDNQPKGTRQ